MPYIHHIIIHFVVALSLAAAAFHIAGWVKPGSGWADSARRLTFLATAAALVAAGSGLLSAGHAVEQGGDADKIALHRNVALVATALLVAAAVATWLLARRATAVTTWAARGLLLTGAATAGVAAHLGGDMLHPGLAPWSSESHHHGPQSSPADSGMHPSVPGEPDHAAQHDVPSVTNDEATLPPDGGAAVPPPSGPSHAQPESAVPPSARPPDRRPPASPPTLVFPKPAAPSSAPAATPGHEGHVH